MPTIDLPAGTLNYRVYGPPDAARSVVFIHPILVDGRLWTPVAERLAEQGIQSYLPDWPLGSHRIPLQPDADRSPAGMAQLIRDFLEALDLRGVTLVGNDTGGALTQYVLVSGEPRVQDAVLMNCDAFDSFPPFPITLILAPLRSESATRGLGGMMRWRALRHSWMGFGLLSKNLPADLTSSWLEPAQTDPAIRHDLSTLLKALDPKELLEVSTHLHEVTVPVKILWGMSDVSFRPKLGRRLAAAFTQAEWIEIPGARTLLALDAPDAVTAAIVGLRS